MKHTLKSKPAKDMLAVPSTDWQRELRVPVSAEIAKAMKVGAKCMLECSGKVTGVSSNATTKGDGEHTVTLYLDSVEYEGKDEPESYDKYKAGRRK